MSGWQREGLRFDPDDCPPERADRAVEPRCLRLLEIGEEPFRPWAEMALEEAPVLLWRTVAEAAVEAPKTSRSMRTPHSCCRRLSTSISRSERRPSLSSPFERKARRMRAIASAS